MPETTAATDLDPDLEPADAAEPDGTRSGGAGSGATYQPGSGGGVSSRLGRAFGPMTAWRVVILLVAFAFLGGAVGWAIAGRDDDPLSATDVGFMQDMGYHHDQAVQMSSILLNKQGIDPDLRSYALEIIISQQADRGIFNATLDRFGHSSSPGEEVMGWMFPVALPRDEMEGLASPAQIEQLKAAQGDEAEALWIALMSEHHLGGMHMGDWEARHGHDNATRNMARAGVATQYGEITDLSNYRIRRGLPIPEGFSDPTKDQRMNPLSLTQD